MAKLFPCMECEKRYNELEEAEQCERRHALARLCIDDSDYFRSNGKAPRGEGSWAFCTVPPETEGYLDHVIWCRGDYRAALREAKKVAAERGVRTLYVCA